MCTKQKRSIKLNKAKTLKPKENNNFTATLDCCSTTHFSDPAKLFRFPPKVPIQKVYSCAALDGAYPPSSADASDYKG
ncbi:unnamed protein product [Caretta caretta]